MWPSLRSQVIHGDVTLDNALVDERGRISGIIDWGDMSHSALVCDLSSALESLLEGRSPDEVVPRVMRFVDGYRSVTPLEPEELQVLPDLLSVRIVTVAVLFGWRAKRHPEQRLPARLGGPAVAAARRTWRPRAASSSAPG